MFPTRSIVRIRIQTFMYEKQRLSFNLTAFYPKLLLLQIISIAKVDGGKGICGNLETEFKEDGAEFMDSSPVSVPR